MLLYSLYHNTEVVDGLVRDTGFRCRGWADVEALRHLCAKVTGKGNQIYFVDGRAFTQVFTDLIGTFLAFV
jgi:hypothetical protein